MPPMPSNSTRHNGDDSRFLPRRKIRPRAKAPLPPANGHGELLRLLLLGAVVVIVMVVVPATLPFGVTVAGEKLHAAPLGNPEHAKAVGWLKPLTGVMLIVSVPLFPRAIIRVAAPVARLKSGDDPAVPTVSVVAADMLSANFESPPYVAVTA